MLSITKNKSAWFKPSNKMTEKDWKKVMAFVENSSVEELLSELEKRKHLSQEKGLR